MNLFHDTEHTYDVSRLSFFQRGMSLKQQGRGERGVDRPSFDAASRSSNGWVIDMSEAQVRTASKYAKCSMERGSWSFALPVTMRSATVGSMACCGCWITAIILQAQMEQTSILLESVGKSIKHVTVDMGFRAGQKMTPM